MGGAGSGRKGGRAAIPIPEPKTAPKKVRRTNYSLAWGNYKLTSSYLRLRNYLLAMKMTQPYIDNFIQLAFQDGFNASDVKIELID